MPLGENEPHIAEFEDATTIVASFDGNELITASRLVPVEVPVNIVYGGIPFAVMMATPSDMEDFAVGFSLTEGVTRGPEDIRNIQVVTQDKGLKLAIDLTPERLHEHLARKRAMSGRTGCGVCGIDDLEALRQVHATDGVPPQISLAAIRRALTSLQSEQSLNNQTHAVHAAAWFDFNGAICYVREDVGRHNALDKLIGALSREGMKPDSGFAVVTSRCSFEMVEKVAAFGARTLIAISAPTSLALERARCLDVTLACIARSDSVTVFHGVERVLGAGLLYER